MTECYVNHFGVFSDYSAAVMEGSSDAPRELLTDDGSGQSDQQWE